MTVGGGRPDPGRLRAVWRRVFVLAWPVMAEQVFRTAMRTTDVVVTALFSPAAVVAIGLADLYARFPLHIGLGLGGDAIALSSQDTGAGATATRDEAVTQAVLLGFLAGFPFVLFGAFLGDLAIAVFGASAEVVRLGSTYLAIIFATAPARHVALVGARALQGTGDTTTPMYVNVFANSLNIAGSVLLVLFTSLSGSLQGASETRIPFVARMTGMFGLFLGGSWLLGRSLGYGPPGAYVGVFLAFAWMALVVVWGFGFTGWATRAADMMAERGSTDPDPTDD